MAEKNKRKREYNEIIENKSKEKEMKRKYVKNYKKEIKWWNLWRALKDRNQNKGRNFKQFVKLRIVEIHNELITKIKKIIVQKLETQNIVKNLGNKK